MNLFTKILLGLVVAGEKLGPLFIHSQHGTMVLNTSEEVITDLIQAFAKPQAAATSASSGTTIAIVQGQAVGQ